MNEKKYIQASGRDNEYQIIANYIKFLNYNKFVNYLQFMCA